jgi:hypothetical protein
VQGAPLGGVPPVTTRPKAGDSDVWKIMAKVSTKNVSNVLVAKLQWDLDKSVVLCVPRAKLEYYKMINIFVKTAVPENTFVLLPDRLILQNRQNAQNVIEGNTRLKRGLHFVFHA